MGPKTYIETEIRRHMFSEGGLGYSLNHNVFDSVAFEKLLGEAERISRTNLSDTDRCEMATRLYFLYLDLLTSFSCHLNPQDVYYVQGITRADIKNWVARMQVSVLDMMTGVDLGFSFLEHVSSVRDASALYYLLGCLHRHRFGAAGILHKLSGQEVDFIELAALIRSMHVISKFNIRSDTRWQFAVQVYALFFDMQVFFTRHVDPEDPYTIHGFTVDLLPDWANLLTYAAVNFMNGNEFEIDVLQDLVKQSAEVNANSASSASPPRQNP